MLYSCTHVAPLGVKGLISLEPHKSFVSATAKYTISYKIVTLVHRCLSGHVPSYMADDCRLVTDADDRRLRSADTRTLVVSRTQSSLATEHSLWQHLGSRTVCN